MKIKTLLLSVVFAPMSMMADETPTMGWSSWNTFSVHISEDIIKGQADAMVSQGLFDVGYNYINIDDGFQYGRTPEGKVRIHPERFPNGLKVVSDYIHSKGLKAGIYSDAGDCTCGSIGNGDVYNTNVGFYGYEQIDADYYFKECEFDFIKVDYCGGTHLGLDEQTQYTAIHNAILNTGRDVRYNLCRWAYPGNWCHDVSTSWRTTGDIYDGWESVRGILAENLYMSAYCFGGCYNDMDMLEVGRSMTAEEDLTHFGMWCIMSSPLLIGCNMSTIKPAALELLKNRELIALNQDLLGIQAYVVQRSGDTYVLTKDLQTLHGTKRAVAFYNPSDKAVLMAVSLSELDLGGKAHVRDLVNHVDLPECEHAFSVMVPAHGSRFYTFDADVRLERYIYEGETAYLNDYQECYNHEAKETAIYQGGGSASGGVYAGWLGKRKSNHLAWKDVYSLEGGDYVAHFCVGTQESRSFTIEVNGVDVSTVTASTGGWETFKEYDVTIHLEKGSNTVVLYNDGSWMPNIDYMSLERVGDNAILDRRLEEASSRLATIAGGNALTIGLQQKIQSLLSKTTDTTMTDSQKSALISDLLSMIETVNQVLPLISNFDAWCQNANSNIAVSVESSALSTFKEKAETALASFDSADSYNAANKAFTNYKNAYKTFLKASDAMPLEGEQLDMTFLLNNFDFSETSGWVGDPAYRSGCGEEYNKTFNMYQTLSGMKPGVYTVRCNALYRPTHNDGGTKYKAGTENIAANFYVNDASQPVVSLYSEEWPEASQYGGVDNLNGYPHSMYAAGLRFAEGCYLNEMEYTMESKGTLKIGLESAEHQDGNWCCFDNFSISYRALPSENAIMTVVTAPTSKVCYDLQGRKVISAHHGVVVQANRKVVKY